MFPKWDHRIKFSCDALLLPHSLQSSSQASEFDRAATWVDKLDQCKESLCSLMAQTSFILLPDLLKGPFMAAPSLGQRKP